MAATHNSGIGHGSIGSPQENIEEMAYIDKVETNENKEKKPPVYKPIRKHDPEHSFKNASVNPIKSKEEGQHLLDTGIMHGKQIYNVTEDGKIVKFQPDNTPENGYHAYEVSSLRDIPSKVLKELFNRGRISKVQYNKFRKGHK